VRISISNYLKQRELKTIDVDWLNDTHSIVATNDGCLRVMDRSLSITNSPSSQITSMREDIKNVYLIDYKEALNVKFLLQHLKPKDGSMFSYESTPEHVAARPKETQMLLRMDEELIRDILGSENLLQRCTRTAKFYGDTQEHLLWRLLENVLKDLDRIKNNIEERKKVLDARRTQSQEPIELEPIEKEDRRY